MYHVYRNLSKTGYTSAHIPCGVPYDTGTFILRLYTGLCINPSPAGLLQLYFSFI